VCVRRVLVCSYHGLQHLARARALSTMSLVKGTAVDCESSGGGVGQLTQVPQPASNFDPKTLRYGLLARTNAGLGEAMQVQSYCSPLMRNTFWNGSEWVRKVYLSNPLILLAFPLEPVYFDSAINVGIIVGQHLWH